MQARILFLVFVTLAAGCHSKPTVDRVEIASSPDLADAVQALGTESLPPFTSEHFAFLDGQYVQVPYVISRRGNYLYLNEHPLRMIAEWPPYDYRVNIDPGPPPPGLSPIGPDPDVDRFRDGYWSRKARYIASHYPPQEAKRRYHALLMASDAVVDFEVDDAGILRITDQAGRQSSVGFGTATFPAPPTPERWLEDRREGIDRSMQSLQSRLEQPGLTLLRTNGGASSAGHIRPVLTDLLERPLSLEERRKRSFTLRDGVDDWLKQFNNPHPQFVERAERYLAGEGR